MPNGSLKQFCLKFQRTFHWPIFEIIMGFLCGILRVAYRKTFSGITPPEFSGFYGAPILSSHCPEIMPQEISLNNLLKRGLKQTDYRTHDSLIAGFRRSWNGIPMEKLRASTDSIADRLRKIIAAKGDLIDCDQQIWIVQ